MKKLLLSFIVLFFVGNVFAVEDDLFIDTTTISIDMCARVLGDGGGCALLSKHQITHLFSGWISSGCNNDDVCKIIISYEEGGKRKWVGTIYEDMKQHPMVIVEWEGNLDDKYKMYQVDGHTMAVYQPHQ